MQELVEGEQEDFLGGRGRYERRGEGQAGWRNGYERGRLRTAEGPVDVAVPQVRGAGAPFRPALMSFLDGNSEVLDRLVTEMYARGLSTRDVEDAFRDATGELLVSRSAVSEITDRLWADYQGFIARDLSGIEVVYLLEQGQGLADDVADGGSADIAEGIGEDIEGAQSSLVEKGEQDPFAVADLLAEDAAAGAGLAWAARRW